MSDTTYNGWANHATWSANLFLNGDYGTEPDREWEHVVRQQDRRADALARLVRNTLLDQLATLPSSPTRLFLTDCVTSHLEGIDWQELAEHHTDTGAGADDDDDAGPYTEHLELTTDDDGRIVTADPPHLRVL